MYYDDIYSQIAKFYPIGVDRFDPNYQEFPGFQILMKKIENKMAPEYYANKWKPLVKSVKSKFPEIKRASAETLLMDVGYSGHLVIKEEVINSIHFRQTLVFHLSVIECFFTIYGRNDMSIMYSKNNKENLIFDPIITVPPVGVYEKYYNHVYSKIYDCYPESTFLPYILLKQRIDGLSLDAHLKENQSGSIFQALFVGENLTDYKTQGNEF